MMDPQKIAEMASLLRQNGDKILSSEFTLTLSECSLIAAFLAFFGIGSALRALNDSLTLIADIEIGSSGVYQQHQSFKVVKPINAKSSVFSDLQLVHDFVQKTTLLRLTYFPCELYFEAAIDIAKFRALRRLEVNKINICQVVGIQPLRGQLQHLICVRSLTCLDDIIIRCGGDNSNGFVWNELQSADFSYNNLRSVDSALEFAQNLQHLNLQHNKLNSVAAVKWLPHLKTLNLSYNCLKHIPQIHMEACKRLQLLNISNNYIEELQDVAKLDALRNLDLSHNCLLEHSQLLPLSALFALNVLNVQGNPLACHPVHRLATAKYLAKNSASVKFVLDFEPLSKAEKALTGSQRCRYIESLINRHPRSSSISINSSSSSINNRDGYQFSCVGSQHSVIVKGHEYPVMAEQSMSTPTSQFTKKSVSTKIRTVEIEENTEITAESSTVSSQRLHSEGGADSSHLETKKQIETLRLTYGNEWLRAGNAELMLGIKSPQPTELERDEARKLFNEFLGEFSVSSSEIVNSQADPEHIKSSWSPANNSWLNTTFNTTLTPIKSDANDTSELTFYETCTEGEMTNYESLGSTTNKWASEKALPDKHKELLRLFANASSAGQDENPVSDAESDEETFIVYHEQKPSEALFFTISSNFIREKDTLTERTKTKWSLKILESCERVKSNTLRIIFNTMRKDKQERIYCVDSTLCKELEKKLRDILSQRHLIEMNISIYRCMSCVTQFTIEQKSKRYLKKDLRCPDCRSVYVAEVTELCPSLIKLSEEVLAEPKHFPAVIGEENLGKTITGSANNEESNSIGSASSLNESSSCSKITNSQSSFDSNQSVVGSSNTNRDLEFRANESDVDIISNPSQSSIEVLDPKYGQNSSRKTSEERQLSHLETLRERKFCLTQTEQDRIAAPASSCESQVPLTESSSSGSITDSICTTYEQLGIAAPTNLSNLLLTESVNSQISSSYTNSNSRLKKAEKVSPLPFAAVFHSTNLIMSSSKKMVDSEANVLGSQPYKFNYIDFNDIDHRLKLFFYQHKFKEDGEHFKWLAKGRFFNEQTQALGEGIFVMSNCNCFLMESFAIPQEDVAKWLRQVVRVSVDRLQAVELLPWKLGFSFTLKDWGGFILLLHDTLTTDSLLLFLRHNPLPEKCKLNYKPSTTALSNSLKTFASELVKMCSMLSSCQWIREQEKNCFEPCLLIITESHVFISVNLKLSWLSNKTQDKSMHPELTLRQPISNLVEVERITDQKYVMNFNDETQNKCEIWQLVFETHNNSTYCMNVIGTRWERLFGVPFSVSET
ncbi:serine/threonine-protein kinase 11-interacting protein isoform X4 [Drosophila biarmipes]|uniref:serine/threonine-protein kinase 11-interacting protein isoform X4 n=1 Tax=Drosophila biarmipes TaxID=125945 RepID=UPI001CDA907A|nr:serine/threonine-protein kinase 11-interacting protein isoform X4 [Drosophila biarmipes]